MPKVDLKNIFKIFNKSNKSNSIISPQTSNTTEVIHTAVTTTEQILQDIAAPQSNKFDLSKSGLISTLYTCIRLKADILSTLPFKVYKKNKYGFKEEFKEDPRYKLLHDEPNNYQNSQQLRSAMLWDMYWYGNGFARIYRNGWMPERYEYIDALNVKTCAKWNDSLWYLIEREEITNDGKIEKIQEAIYGRDIYHFRNSTSNSLWGISARDALFLTLSSSYKGLKTLDNFYNNNLFLQKALKTVVPDIRLEDKIIESSNEFDKKYIGFNPKEKLIRLPYNADLVDVTSSIQDAQVIESIKFNANQIATALGVPTILIGDNNGAKFSNVELLLKFFEATSLRVESDIIRRETEYKFFTTKEYESGMSAEFNFNQFAQSDNAGRASNYRTYFSMGVLSPNQIAGIEGFPTYEGGDIHIINGGGQTVETMALKTNVPIENTSQDDKLDNLIEEINTLKNTLNDLKNNLDK